MWGMNQLPYGLLLLFLTGNQCDAFTQVYWGGGRQHVKSSNQPSPLFGIAEWRDDHPTTMGVLELVDTSPIRRVPLMLVESDEVVLQGQKKCFQFTRHDELRIFQRALDYNHGIFGLGLVSDEEEGILERILLMEIIDFKMDLGIEYGIFCEAQVMGRASLLCVDTTTSFSYPAEATTTTSYVDDDKEPVTAICVEYVDRPEECFGLDDVIEMATQVAYVIAKLSDKEEAYIKTFAQDEDDCDGDDGDDFDNDNETRQDRFRQAIQAAHESDCQGYVSSTQQTFQEGTPNKAWSWKDVNAISWAAFSSSLTPKLDETFRLQALDSKLVTNRLQLATYWLSDVLKEVEQSNSSR
jgi:hypothetical protein